MELSGWEWIGRLAVAAVLSGIIGFEREAHHKAAGLRTHILVGMGAALFALAGIDSFGAGDVSRIAAGVVTGVGFLGAGAIFHRGPSVRGLTTAAGLWVVAAIGIVTGAGDLVPAAAATALAVVAMNGLSLVEQAMRKRSERRAARLVVSLSSSRALADALHVVSGVDERVRGCDVQMDDDGSIKVTFLVDPTDLSLVTALMTGLEGVTSVESIAAR